MSFGIGRRGEATGAEYHDEFGTSCTGAIDLRFPAEGAELAAIHSARCCSRSKTFARRWPMQPGRHYRFFRARLR